jgi:hypothetical protein
MVRDCTDALGVTSPVAWAAMQLRVLPDRYAVVRLAPGAELPSWVDRGPFRSVTRTDNEVSIVCRDRDVPDGESAERGWRVLEVTGPLDFSLSGVVASLVVPLAAKEIPIFAISTFETDYGLGRGSDLDAASRALAGVGHLVGAA